MGTPIPVICRNPSCRAVWFTASAFGIAPGAYVQIMQTQIGGCPSCGGFGYVPDGVYTSASAALLNRQQFDAVFSALSQIRERLSPGASASEFEQEIRHHPVLEHLYGFVPKDLKDIAILLAIIYGIIAFCRSGDPGSQKIQMNRDVYEDDVPGVVES